MAINLGATLRRFFGKKTETMVTLPIEEAQKVQSVKPLSRARTSGMSTKGPIPLDIGPLPTYKEQKAIAERHKYGDGGDPAVERLAYELQMAREAAAEATAVAKKGREGGASARMHPQRKNQSTESQGERIV